MNKTRVVTIICWTISALALTGLVIWLLIGSLFNFGPLWNFGVGTFEPVGTHSVSAEDMDSLYIDWTSGAVSIATHEGNEIQITEFAQRSLRTGEHLSLDTEGGTLTIHFAERIRLTGNMPAKQLEVLIPHALSENFASFYVNTVSGRIEARNIQADVFATSTTSGRIELRNITAQDLEATTVSGRIELFTTEAEQIQLRTVSGRIGTTNTQAQTLHAQTTSGRVELSGSFHDVSARSSSGRIDITSHLVPERLAAHTSSGRIEVTVPNEGPVHVQHSTGSGRFSSAVPVITHGDEDAQFHLSTGSGRISIYELVR